MTYEQLKKVALTQFALHGYEGASLTQIASEVGIKKQSIYTHFKSKDELFISTFNDAVNNELLFVKKFISKNKAKPLREILYNFLNEYLDSYNKENSNTSFFLRTSFFPPIQLKDLIKIGTDKYVSELEEIFKLLFEQKCGILKPIVNERTATLAFLTILDGLFVELLYGNSERLAIRLSEAWYVYWQGISNERGG
ncbi:TetR/AcrR family transcriptional regulator [Cytobacillus sp. FSL K6-0265]|uniref:TetR/AcrR family transcriptional regulator n=1 Tax=Cytobacillus sp. FSL K6-0265 TaxID=2921448 RepID=UPI0030F7466B